MKTNDRLDAATVGLDPALFTQGAGEHPWIVRLASSPGRSVGLDLADAVHWLQKLHGGAAGLVDGASLRTQSSGERVFLTRAFGAWQCERKALSTLTVAVGPIPSTSGQVGDEATTVFLATAIATLATSDRAGVALGAAAALIVEWRGLRSLMDRAADRFAATIPPCVLPSHAEMLATVAGFIDTPAIERAAAFGARQLLRQHGQFVAMLERRSQARERN